MDDDFRSAKMMICSRLDELVKEMQRINRNLAKICEIADALGVRTLKERQEKKGAI